MINKERLMEIKNSYLVGVHRLFGTPWVTMPKENFDWLIQQAERYEDLLEQVKQIEKVSDYNADLRMKYEKALEFYAHKKNYDIKHLNEDEHEIPVFKDYGEKARQALEGKE